MRVIAGKYKGRRLYAPTSAGVRPALDKVKGAIFNILAGCVEGGVALDLFAGTGSIGIEALSRGALRCTFVESDRTVLKALKRNLESCQAGADSEIFPIPVHKALSLLKKRGERYDLIFVDPPYDRSWIEKTLPLLGGGDWSQEGSTMVVEHSPREVVSDRYGCWMLMDQRAYGQTRISFFEQKGDI